jgi:hypothetical protein
LKHIALLALLLAAGCAGQQMRQSYLPVDAAQDQALNECRFLVAQNPAAIDWYMVNRAGTPITGSDGALTALTQHGADQMKRCMGIKGYRPGPMVPYHG